MILSANELNEHSFSRKINGYNTGEVDDYIQYLLDKYTELYDAEKDCERRLNIANEKLDEIERAEKTAESILDDANKRATAIIAEAENKGKVLTDSVNESIELLIEEYRKKVVLQTEILCELAMQCNNFKKKVIEGYQSQIDYLNSTDFPDSFEKTDEEFINEVLLSAKERIRQKKRQQEDIRENDENDNNFSPVTVSEERVFTDIE